MSLCEFRKHELDFLQSGTPRWEFTMERTKRVLVTGANGHVGSNLVKALLERGYCVRASVRDTNGTYEFRKSLLLKDLRLMGGE